MNKMPELSKPMYRIGAVSRLTGIPAVTIRIWERRYNVVEPDRSEGRNRLYTREDISRLALIKQLVNAGNAISTVANLSLGQLQERLEAHTRHNLNPTDMSAQHRRIAILGDAFASRIMPSTAALEGIDVVVVERDPQQFMAKVAGLEPDVIIVEYPAVYEETVAEVQALLAQSGAGQALVIYGFGSQKTVRQLDSPGILPLRAPVDFPELKHLILGSREKPAEQQSDLNSATLTASIPPRRFDNDSLARIATTSTAVQCECPHHLVELVVSLVAFEGYSAECKNRNPEDAIVHSYLWSVSARARAAMEEALAQVVELEGLKF